jgi:patatin-like phospholipase/acyl hydrolase
MREPSSLRRSDGTLHGLREALPWPEGKPFRILSIDGGGIRGILPASILTKLEERYLPGKSAGDYFDLITGTSTGGIIALALSIGLPAKAILDIYMQHGAEVFPALGFDLLKMRSGLRFIRGLRHHTYDPDKLLRQLEKIFGQTLLGDAKRRLCIPTFDGFTEVNIFKTAHHKDYQRDWREQMVTAAMATAAAPVYFPVYKDRGRFFADGGVWANNPVMIGLVDALACHQLERRQVHILSLGSGDTDVRITENQIRLGGLWHWRDVISSAMHLQSQNAIGQAGLLIGRDQLIRLNAPPMPESPIALDDYARASRELPPIATRLVDEQGDIVRDRFLFEPAVPYKAFYGPRAEI